MSEEKEQVNPEASNPPDPHTYVQLQPPTPPSVPPTDTVPSLNPEGMGVNRIVVVENVYHQAEGGMNPTHVYPKYTQFLTTDEQPYLRHTKVGEQWVQLDTGWLKECSLIVLENMEGLFQFRNPTEQEVEEATKKVIEIGFSSDLEEVQRAMVKTEVDPHTGRKMGRTMHSPPKSEQAKQGIQEYEAQLMIPPLQSQRIIPISPRRIYIRCRSGMARISISAFPI